VNADSTAHLDAETMAAWVDQALSAPDAAAAEAHMADCARCQAMLAVLVKTLPAAPAIAPWWRRRWVVGTLVPLAAGSLALAVWVATPRQMTPTVAPAAAPAAPAQTLADRNELSGVRPQTTAEPGRLASDPRQTAPPGSSVSDTAPTPPRPRSDTTPTPQVATVDELRRREALAAPAAPPERPAAADAAALPAAAAPAVMRAAAAQAMNKAAAAVDVLSPDPSIRWRLGAAGSIQRSADAGATWDTQPSGVTKDLVAGSAPQSGVCWVVGRVGTVLLSTDGNRWRKLEFPEIADLTAIAARDARTAIVTAADGRQFQTIDAGQIWTRLQDF
jgi:hypothetical protein